MPNSRKYARMPGASNKYGVSLEAKPILQNPKQSKKKKARDGFSGSPCWFLFPKRSEKSQEISGNLPVEPYHAIKRTTNPSQEANPPNVHRRIWRASYGFQLLRRLERHKIPRCFLDWEPFHDFHFTRGEAFTQTARAWQKSLDEARGLFLSSSLLLFRPRDLWRTKDLTMGTNGFEYGISLIISDRKSGGFKRMISFAHLSPCRKPRISLSLSHNSLFFPRSFARSERFGCWKHWKF